MDESGGLPRFAGCRTCAGETCSGSRAVRVGAFLVLAFLVGVASAKSKASPIENGAAEPSKTSLPQGTILYVRLQTPVSTKASHLGGPVTAQVVRDVPKGTKVAIPLGAVVRGQVKKLVPSSNPSDRARILLRFTRLELPGQPPITLGAHVKEVENAREKVLGDGTVQGVLASELPLAHLEDAIGKLGKQGEELQKMQQKAFGQSDTSINYPQGTDLVLILDQPLPVEDRFEPAVPEILPQGTQSTLDRLLAEAPPRASSKDGKPGDPVNLLIIGNQSEITQIFLKAGWSEAEKKSAKSIWETIRAVAGDQGYGAAPVSELYLFDRPEDLAFEKILNTFAKRHHLRLWRSPVTISGGRAIWLGAATHDSGLDVRPGVVSHAIDPDLDAEREKVGADLAATGLVAAERLLTRTHPLLEGFTATGAPWKTDGKALAIELKPR